MPLPHNVRYWTLALLFTIGTMTSASVLLAGATEPEKLLLWPQGAPGANGTQEKDRPGLFVYLPAADKANGAAVVICPGGGYGGLAMGYEGHDIARWLNSLGIAGLVLDYRHRGKGYGHPAPLQDAQRAIRLARARAADWKIAPNRIGILGFSAGGHLASTAATHFDRGDRDSADVIQRQSCRPDFAILCYAVIAFNQPCTHRGSQTNLIGKDASEQLATSLSNDRQVTSETPPTFLWSTDQDKAVPAENSVLFYLACRQAKVPAELHIFRVGRHGTGLAKNIAGTGQWPALCQAWLQHIGMLEDTKRN